LKNKVNRTNPYTEEELKENIGRNFGNFSGRTSLGMYRNSIFSTSYNTGKFILSLLWSNTSLTSGKPCTAWH
jgi:hypothetical protein